MQNANIVKLRFLLQHAEVLNNFSRLLDRAAGLLTTGQVSNRPDVPEILPQELHDLVGPDTVRKIKAAHAAFHSPELLDPKPEPEAKIIYIEVPAEPAAPAAEEPVAPAAEEPVAPPAPDVTEPTA
jgi:hypothetical protein